MSTMSSADVTGRLLAEAAASLEAGLEQPGSLVDLDPEVLQRILAVAVRAYAARYEAVGDLAPFPPATEGAPTPNASEVCRASTLMLEAVSVEIFELAMWQTWTAVEGGPRPS
jgi:hypothetical protein